MTNIWKVLVGVSLVLSVMGIYISWSSSLPLTATYGSLGVKLAENYDPYIRYNGGYYSNLPIQTTSTFAAGATTITGTLTVSATSTLNGNLNVVTSNTATSSIQVGCIQTVATSTLTPIAVTFSTIATTTTMANGLSNNGFVLWQYGKCPRV